MQENYEKIAQLISEGLQLIDFYTIRFTGSGVCFQGNFKPEIILKYKQMQYAEIVDGNGYVNMTKENVTLVFT